MLYLLCLYTKHYVVLIMLADNFLLIHFLTSKSEFSVRSCCIQLVRKQDHFSEPMYYAI